MEEKVVVLLEFVKFSNEGREKALERDSRITFGVEQIETVEICVIDIPNSPDTVDTHEEKYVVIGIKRGCTVAVTEPYDQIMTAWGRGQAMRDGFVDYEGNIITDGRTLCGVIVLPVREVEVINV